MLRAKALLPSGCQGFGIPRGSRKEATEPTETDSLSHTALQPRKSMGLLALDKPPTRRSQRTRIGVWKTGHESSSGIAVNSCKHI
jgi:hypothetical protein